MTRTIEPIGTVEHVECVAEPSARRVQCQVCSKVFAGGSVVTLSRMSWPASMSRVLVLLDRASIAAERIGASFELRGLYCDHCNQVQIWAEAVGAGEFKGQPIDKPLRLRQRTSVARFLRLYPQAQGVIQR